MSIGVLDSDRVSGFGALLRQQAAKEKATAAANRQEAEWKETDVRLTERRRRQNAAGWYAHHAGLADLYAELSLEHERKALAFLDGDGA